MSTLPLNHEPKVTAATTNEIYLVIDLADGRGFSVPLEWYPRLLHATRSERQNCRIWEDGDVLEWPDLDEHISLEAILAGRRSGETEQSFQQWLQARKPG